MRTSDPADPIISDICAKYDIERVYKMSGVIHRSKPGTKPDYVAAAAAIREAMPFRGHVIPASVAPDGRRFMEGRIRVAQYPYEAAAEEMEYMAGEAAKAEARAARKAANKAEG